MHGPRVSVGPDLVVRHDCGRAGCGVGDGSGARAGCGIVRAWGQGCMVVHGPRIGSEGRAGCAWEQGWLCMGTGLVVHGDGLVGVELVVQGVRTSM